MNWNPFKIISTFSDAIQNAGSSFLASQLGPNERPVTADEIEMVRLIRQERERTTRGGRQVVGGGRNPDERRTSPRYVPGGTGFVGGATGYNTPPRDRPLPLPPAWKFQQEGSFEDAPTYTPPPIPNKNAEKQKNL